MTRSYPIDSEVEWKWGQGTGRGKVREVFRRHVTRSIKGSEISRNASDDNPAYLIEQDDGDTVLKSHSELHKIG